MKTKQLQKEWKEVELSEVTECLDGKRVPLNSEERKKIQGDIPYYGANGQVDSINKFIFDEELLLIAEDGGSWGPNQKCVYIINGKSWVNNHAHVLRVKKDIANIFFLKHWLNKQDLNRYISGTTRGKLNQKIMNEIKIPLPSLQIQKAIVSILEKAEKLKQQRGESDKLTKEYLQSVFYEMFGNKGFEEVELGSIARLTMGGTPSTSKIEYWDNGKVNWMKSGDIKRDFIYSIPNRITELGLKNSNAEMYPTGTVVIALNGQGRTRGTTAILNIETSSNQSVCGIIPNHVKISSIYLHFNLKFRYQELRNITGDNDRSGLNLTILRGLSISLPPIELQQKFASIVEEVEKLKEKQKQSKEELKIMFNSLMKQAFNGELVK